MHALVGYVELGTDSWITNISTTVLKNPNTALGVFIWTNLLMFTLRFFAGPIVHQINPIGLLFASAALGTIGLYLLGHPWVDSVWPWVAAVTVYGLGKTFYWPTLLGVISERFPKGGALALGLSGGVGMLSAGLLGGPGIGYEQDYYAVESVQGTSKPTYDRYVARKDDGELDKKSFFPLATSLMPEKFPMIAGLDNSKLKVLDDYSSFMKDVADAKAAHKEPPKGPATTLEADLATLKKDKEAGKKVEEKLEQNLTKQYDWWTTSGKPYSETDKKPLDDARFDGAKNALLYTAFVPATLAVGFLLLMIYFKAIGGYKQLHVEDEV
jgi:hypothetical protein